MSWSWDNRYLLITNTEETGSRLLRITVADGTVTEVQPGLRGVAESRFSPDGQFIAYWRAGIYVIPSGGGESHRIATVPVPRRLDARWTDVLIGNAGPMGGS